MALSLENERQTKEERAYKYKLARELGRNVSWSRAMRDYRWPTLLRHLGLDSPENREYYRSIFKSEEVSNGY